MVFKAERIVEMHDALEKLSHLNLSLVNAITIAENIDTVSTAYKIINDKRQKCVEKYAKKDEQGNYVQSKDNPDAIMIDNPQGYMKEISEILQAEIELEMKEFSLDGENVSIAPADVIALRSILKLNKDNSKQDDKQVETD